MDEAAAVDVQVLGGQNGLVKTGLILAAAWHWPSQPRHCLVFVNKICQSRDADLHMVFRLFCFNKSLTKTALFEPLCLFFAILGSSLDSREAEKSPLAKAMAVQPINMNVEFNKPPPHNFFLEISRVED